MHSNLFSLKIPGVRLTKYKIIFSFKISKSSNIGENSGENIDVQATEHVLGQIQQIISLTHEKLKGLLLVTLTILAKFNFVVFWARGHWKNVGKVI